MNAAEMARTAYGQSRPSIRTDRSTEYDVFARITHNLKAAIERGKPGFTALVQALHENRKLWTILAADVAGNDNALPEQLRAQIFYLAEFTDMQSRKILAGTADAAILVEINTNIMRGLRSVRGLAA
ncbi:MAG: flagellar biosynthesis regulator FlaF [Rhodobacteraceae bacterium]|nr:flagellar biosynthesis regulator FlaF [Paracoccaceae bacterium]